VFWHKVRIKFTLKKLYLTAPKAANAIELIDYGRDSADVDNAHKIQVFNRFLIDQLSSEGNMFPLNTAIVKRPPVAESTSLLPPVTQLMGIDGKNVMTCMTCKNTREKEGVTHIVDLMYPRKVCYLLLPRN
jgi:PAB-dependent poly(A)-specific ribonuclease subunit 2